MYSLLNKTLDASIRLLRPTRLNNFSRIERATGECSSERLFDGFEFTAVCSSPLRRRPRVVVHTVVSFTHTPLSEQRVWLRNKKVAAECELQGRGALTA